MRAVPVPAGTPMAIEPSAFRQMLAWDESTIALRRSAVAADGTDADEEPQLELVGSVAVIKVHGPLSRRDDFWTWLFGGCSYDAIRRQLQLANDNAAVTKILLDIDSPGGDANGCSELADLIFEMRGGKEIVAYIGGMGCSAAYWLASSADRIVCAETALLGSIGVRATLIDFSGADKKFGIRQIDIVSSQSPGKRDLPIDDEVLSKVQRQCDDLAEVFVAKVARGRDVSTDEVLEKFGKGDVLIGQHAVDAGLADEIGSFNQVLSEMSASESAPLFNQGDRTMAKNANAPAGTLKAEDKKPEDKDEDKKESKAEGEDMDAEEKDDDKGCDAKDGDGDDDGDKDDKKADDLDDKDGDKEAKSALAQMAGLKASASLGQIAAALQARTAPLPQLAALQRENARLSADVEKLLSKDITASAEAFVDAAIRDGRTMADKRDHLVAEFGKAERSKSGSGAAALEPSLFAKGTFTLGRQISDGKGGLKGKAEKVATFAQDDGEQIVAAYSKKAAEIAAKEKISFASAMSRVKAVDPELYAAYAALRR
jgi:signal peptide peptidase SppA